MIEPGKTYTGTVQPNSGLIEASTGSTGYQITLKCEDGAISHTIWLTSKNKDNAKADFIALGADPAKLGDVAYIDALPEFLVGHEVPFGTKAEEYKGQIRTKVAWIGEPRAKKADVAAAAKVAAMFADDDSVPF